MVLLLLLLLVVVVGRHAQPDRSATGQYPIPTVVGRLAQQQLLKLPAVVCSRPKKKSGLTPVASCLTGLAAWAFATGHPLGRPPAHWQRTEWAHGEGPARGSPLAAHGRAVSFAPGRASPAAQEGFALRALKDHYNLASLRGANFTLGELLSSGFSKKQLREGGFTAAVRLRGLSLPSPLLPRGVERGASG